MATEMSEDKTTEPVSISEIKRRRHGARLNVYVAVLIAFAVLAVSNYCSSMLYAHWHFDNSVPGGLSSRTQEVLQRSQGEIRMTALFERSHPFRQAARTLLREYAEAAILVQGLTIKTTSLDVNHDIVETSEMMRRFPAAEVNSIIIESGSSSRIINEREMKPLEGSGLKSSQEIVFAGESACTTAIMQLLHPVNSVVYFLEGHGEYDPENHHHITGASGLWHALTINGLTVKRLNLQQSPTIPENSDVLVIAGPRTMFSPKEVDTISSYLANGGKAMILVDDIYASGLTSVIENWGIKILPPADKVMANHYLSTTLYGDHPITKRLANTLTVFSNPCIIEPLTSGPVSERADKPKITPLVLVPQKKILENTPDANKNIALAVACELGGATLTGRRHNTKLVVCGDSEFASNAMTQSGFEGNTVFLLASFDWLLGHRNLPIGNGDSAEVLNAGIDVQNGWLMLGLRIAVAFPLAILLSGLLFFVPVFRRL